MTRTVPAVPTDAEIAARLGKSAAAYRRLLADHADLRPEWKYYGPKSGWTLKLFRGSRNLCFVTPGDGSFSVAFLLGEKAVTRTLAADLPEPVRAQIRAARTYVEGRPVKLQVRTLRDLEPARLLLEIKREG